jgi:hypothetical protein
MAEKPKISGRFPAAKESFTFHRQFERDTYFALRERAYQLEDRIRFGLIALNAGSILALVAASSDKGLGGAVGLAPSELKLPLLCFIAGVISVGAALWMQRTNELLHSADAFSRVLAADSVCSSLEMPSEPLFLEEHAKLVKSYHDRPLVGYQWSQPVTWLQALSMGFWVGGTTGIVFSLFF